MLNRVCTGRSSPRLRYRITHQKIRPHTKKPTAKAAMTDPIHRSYIRWASRVMPLPGHPKWPNASPNPSTEQPVSRTRDATAPTPSPPSRTARGRAVVLFTPTCSCLLCGAARRGTGHLAARRHRRSHITRPGPTAPFRGPDLRAVVHTPGHRDDTVPRVGYTGVQAGAAAYLDAATAAPLHPVAREALLAALDDGWADPDRLYAAGRRARRLMEAAQAAAAESLGVRPDELSFWPSGTASVHAAVLGGLAGRERAGRTLVHSAIEHSAVLHAAARHGDAAEVGVDRPR